MIKLCVINLFLCLYLFHVLSVLLFPVDFDTYHLNYISNENSSTEKPSFKVTNELSRCDKLEIDWWNKWNDIIEANNGINIYRYSIGYNFSDDLQKYNARAGIYITVDNDNHTNRLVLHFKNNVITSLSLNAFIKNNEYIPQISKICTIRPNSDKLLIKFDEYLSTDKLYSLDIEYFGKPSHGMNGIYLSEYEIEEKNSNHSNIQYIISTHFEPQFARYAFPCIDEPSMKTTFSIYLTHHRSYKSYSNMPIKHIVDYGNEDITTVFEETPPMSTYLVAFTINNYSSIWKNSESMNNVKVSILLPEHMIEKGRFALDVACKALNLFEYLTQIPYALKKMDLIGIPEFEAGAMENWGLITFRLTQLVFDESLVSIRGKEIVAQTVVHEIAHQWFGNYVTMSDWRDLWLNEGFATFMESYITNSLYPDWNLVAEDRINTIDAAIAFDQLNVTHPISVSENYNEDVKTLFDSIAYGKSSCVLMMLHYVIGDDLFWMVIRKYLNKFSFKSSSSKDLWNIISEEIQTPYANEMIQSWINNVGLPMVTVMQPKYDYGNKSTIILSQKRFLMSSDANILSKVPSEKWIIPISYIAKFKSNSTVKSGLLWLTDYYQKFTMEEDIEWIKINNERIGFFISQYDEDGWSTIFEKIKSNFNIISEIDKVSLLSDSMRLTKNGYLKFNLPLKLISMLMNDISFHTQMACMKYLNAIGWYINENIQIYKIFTKFINTFLHQRYFELNDFALDLKLDNRQRTILLNKVISLCVEYNCSYVVTNLNDLYNRWKNGKTKIEPGMFDVVLRAVAVHGTSDNIKSLEENYKHTHDPHLKRSFLYALAHIKDINLLQRYLYESIYSSFVPKEEVGSFISAVASNNVSRELTWNFVKKNWYSISQKLFDAQTILSSILPSVASQFKTINMIKEVDEFYLANKGKIFHKDYEVAIESIKMASEFSGRIIETLTCELLHV